MKTYYSEELKKNVTVPEDDKKPACNLSDCNGNVFVLAGKVGRTLKQAGFPEQADKFYTELKGCPSYDAALQLMMEYVEVE